MTHPCLPSPYLTTSALFEGQTNDWFSIVRDVCLAASSSSFFNSNYHNQTWTLLLRSIVAFKWRFMHKLFAQISKPDLIIYYMLWIYTVKTIIHIKYFNLLKKARVQQIFNILDRYLHLPSPILNFLWVWYEKNSILNCEHHNEVSSS